MIRELICYKCTCSKCGHNWNTKTHDLPWNCAKCKSKLWNDDYVPVEIEPERPEPVKAKTDDALAAFIAKAQAAKGITQTIDVPIETIDEWAGWSEPRQTRDDEAGEIVHYRQHIKTGKRRILSRETAW